MRKYCRAMSYRFGLQWRGLQSSPMKPGLMIGMSGVSFNQSSPFISPTDDVARKGMGCLRLIWAAGIVFALAGLFCAAGGCSVRHA